jgi:hypothetical protein
MIKISITGANGAGKAACVEYSANRFIAGEDWRILGGRPPQNDLN